MLAYLKQFDPYHHLLLSMALGMLVGLQRQWADTPVAGMRSFTLVSLLGTICAFLAESYGSWMIGIGFFSTIVMAAVARIQYIKTNPNDDQSLVTEFSLLIMFTIGVIVRSESMLLAAALTSILGVLLHVKLELHAIADKFTKEEIRSILQFLVITLVVLPLVPDQSFGKNGAINLQNIWLMVVLIVGIGLAGYIIFKFAGKNVGFIGSGLLGGVISSTATTLSYSRISQGESAQPINALVIIVAWTTLYVRVFLELLFVSSEFTLAIPLTILTLSSIGFTYWSWLKEHNGSTKIAVDYNPTDIKTALFFTLMYTLIIWVFSMLRDELGQSGLSALAFISGILDMDAITLSTGRLVAKGVISSSEGSIHLFLALISNTFFKGIITLVVAGKKLFRLMLVTWLGTLFVQIVLLLYLVASFQ